jgi:hypothetical protein
LAKPVFFSWPVACFAFPLRLAGGRQQIARAAA